MFKHARLETEIAAKRRSWRAILIVLILAFSLGSMGPAVPAQAAPASQGAIIRNAKFHLNVMNPGTLCVGHENALRVTPLVDLDGTWADGTALHYPNKIIPGVVIQAKIEDTSIATIAPPSKLAGVLPTDLLTTHSLTDQAKLDMLGEVVFTITSKKAGLTNLILTAQVPQQWSGSATKYFGPGGDPTGGAIQVVDCKYRVIMVYDWVSSGDVSGWWYGHLDTQIATTGGEIYDGTGSFDFFGRVNIPGCSSSWNGFQIPTQITGTMKTVSSMDFLELKFTYGTATSSATANCDFGSAAGSGTSQPATYGGLPSALFEPQGQTLVFGVPGIGSPAKLTITVQPNPK